MHDATGQIINEFLKHGIAGAVALLALWFAWRKDRETKELYETMFEKVQSMHSQNQALVRDMDETIDTAVRAIERR